MGKFLFGLSLFLFSSIPVASAQFGTPEHSNDNGTVERSATNAIYTWKHFDAAGNLYWVRISTNEGSQRFREVQRHYRVTGHDGTGMLRYIEHDPYKSSIESWAKILQNKAAQVNVDDVALALSFVQSIPYQDVKEYQRFPYETLIDWAGDCSDTTALFAALVDAMGYGIVLLRFESDNHIAVGVKATDSYATAQSGGKATYYNWDNNRYYFAETTGTGWRIGQKPENLKRRAEIVPLRIVKPFMPANDVLVFQVKSNHPYKVFIEFCSDNGRWPEAGQLWVLDDSEWHTYRLECARGESICYGAMNHNNPSNVTATWGAGIDCADSCSDCCYRCGGGSVARIALR